MNEIARILKDGEWHILPESLYPLKDKMHALRAKGFEIEAEKVDRNIYKYRLLNPDFKPVDNRSTAKPHKRGFCL